MRRCGFAVFWVVCGVCVIRIDVGGTLGDVDALCVAVFFMLRQTAVVAVKIDCRATQ